MAADPDIELKVDGGFRILVRQNEDLIILSPDQARAAAADLEELAVRADRIKEILG